MLTEELVDMIAEIRRARAEKVHLEAKQAEHELPKRLRERLPAFHGCLARRGGT